MMQSTYVLTNYIISLLMMAYKVETAKLTLYKQYNRLISDNSDVKKFKILFQFGSSKNIVIEQFPSND